MRDHDVVVVAVIGAEHLDDGLAAGEGAGHADGVHRGLGARVHEAPLRQLEGPGEVLGHDDGVFGGKTELGAERRALLDGLDDQRVGVALDHAAVAVVEVGDLLAVHRPDVRTLAVRVVHGVRVAGVVRGGDAHRHVLDGALEHLVGLRRLVFERLLFAGGEVGDELPVDLVGCHAGFSPSVHSIRERWRWVGTVYHLTVGVSFAGASRSDSRVRVYRVGAQKCRVRQRIGRFGSRFGRQVGDRVWSHSPSGRSAPG